MNRNFCPVPRIPNSHLAARVQFFKIPRAIKGHLQHVPPRARSAVNENVKLCSRVHPPPHSMPGLTTGHSTLLCFHSIASTPPWFLPEGLDLSLEEFADVEAVIAECAENKTQEQSGADLNRAR